ncbi:type II secretion system minor pseudopilin GspI [Natronospirillum operosum]|nr:type II secretion system minor pseudopilin GspI [Natronospirillum operosum]
MSRSTIPQRPGRNRGFTLVEVMVALSIFAVIATSLMYTATQSIRNTEILQERTLGRWVAENHLSELRLSDAPAINNYTDDVSNFGRDWVIRWSVADPESETYGAHLRRVTVSVYLADGETPVDELIALIPVTL